MINEEEDKEGYDVKIDKKSLIRLLQKLSKDKLVKSIRISISGNGKEKHLTFICDPNIDINSSIIQSAVEQAKLKFYISNSQKCKSSVKKTTENTEKLETKKNSNDDMENNPESNVSSSNNSKILAKGSKCGPVSFVIYLIYNFAKIITLVINYNYTIFRLYFSFLANYVQNSFLFQRISRQFGYSPKFVRMQTLHIFLFYLVYEHPGEQIRSKAEQINVLRNNDFNITEELAEEFSTIYTNDVSWRMFVPPLPKYSGKYCL